MLTQRIVRTFILFAATAALLSACQKEEKITDNMGVNKWLHETLEKHYLWSSTMKEYLPSDLSPKAYLEKVRYRDNSAVSLKNDYYGDRFSHIVRNGVASRSGDGAAIDRSDYVNDLGMNIMMYHGSYNTIDYAQIICVVPGSPADKAGVRRGYNFNAIEVGSSVYEMPLSKNDLISLISNRTVKFHFFYPEQKVVEVIRASYLDHPILFDSIYDTSAGKTAYLVYNHFSSGPNNRFNNDLKNVFAKFKREGAENLVLDLRYNGGGELNAAVLLGSLIARAGDLEKPFLYLERNKHKGKDYRQYDVRGFQSLADIGAGNNLDVNKLYIITLDRTASASELVLHCLKPYFGDDLKHVGFPTRGKNVGSITITNPRYDWSLTPITARIHDKNGVSGYEKGIKVGASFPNTYFTDEVRHEIGDGINSPYLYDAVGDFGEIEDGPEVMLQNVIHLINTGDWPVLSRSEGNSEGGAMGKSGQSDPSGRPGRKEAFPAISERGIIEEGKIAF